MAIKVILQTVDGKKEDEILDPEYLLAEIWPVGDSAFPLLRYVDPYGNTIFNRQQMQEVEEELSILIQKVSSDKQREILLRIQAIAEKCKKHPHWLLRFRGD